VTITDKTTGKTESVTIEGDKGRTFACPDGTEAKLEPIDVQAGRIKITLRRVERRIVAIEKRYPNGGAPPAVVKSHDRLVRQDDRLVDAYNAQIDRHNAVINADCTPD
jgi:hypothetical protein